MDSAASARANFRARSSRLKSDLDLPFAHGNRPFYLVGAAAMGRCRALRTAGGLRDQ